MSNYANPFGPKRGRGRPPKDHSHDECCANCKRKVCGSGLSMAVRAGLRNNKCCQFTTDPNK